MKVGINGMGRIGRLALRAALGAAERPNDDPRRGNRLEVVHLNEIKGGAAATAHLLEFDSMQGRWRTEISHDGDRAIHIGERKLSFSSEASPAELSWGDLGVEVVLECTGKFLTPAVLEGHLKRGAKRVIVAAPVKDPSVLNVVVGINEHLYDPSLHPIVTAASCTTNCLAPVVKVVHENLGIRHGQITTIHDPTNTNVVVDAPHKDLRRARSAMLSLQPTTTFRTDGSLTGAATITRLAPRFRCPSSTAGVRNLPVHSRTTSTPRSPQGSSAGDASDEKLSLRSPMWIAPSPSWPISVRQRPCMLSNSSR